MLQFDLLRHGETELSHTLRGSTDDALTENGWQQMHQTVDQAVISGVQWDAIFTSPLQRCRLFAIQAGKQLSLPVMEMPEFQEMHFGDWEAVPVKQIYEQSPEALGQFWTQPTQFTPPQAESLITFEQRVIKGVQQMLQQMQDKQYRRILIVTHGGVIKLLKCKALHQSLDDILKITAELGQLNCFEVSELSDLKYVEQAQ